MELEKENAPLLLSSVYIDLQERSITFTADEQATKLVLISSGILYQQLPGAAITARSVEKLVGEFEEEGSDDPISEREPTVTLSGKLKSKPRQGRADGRGNPTAWARFAGHEEGRKEAHFYLATFHRHTADIALSLPVDAALTVQGYVHPSPQPGRLDTLSVVNIVRYPGKTSRNSQ
jgi:hypothetical protein